ncbi:MAG: exodeoxyribonuclease VII small subunit [Lachnospiraceae bacterium]|nr:exodeoxyribonuclease VII small subunit [Lachnospiraceae bacterium]
MEEQKERSLEENFDRLEELIEALSDSDVSLEDAFRAYSEGINLLKECNDQIDRVEKKVLVLGGNGELEELDQDDPEE